MLKLRWRPAADADVEQIFTYISAHNLTAARKLRDTILMAVERLADHPYMYREGRLAGTREAVVHPNYIVIYQVSDEAVDILRVVHARRHYPSDGG